MDLLAELACDSPDIEVVESPDLTEAQQSKTPELQTEEPDSEADSEGEEDVIMAEEDEQLSAGQQCFP